LTLNIFWYFSLPSIDYDLLSKYWYVISILITVVYALVFRIQLNETHESFYLSVVKQISKILRIKLIKDFEYVLYRAKLSVHEKYRLKYKTHNVEKILIEIEDSRFIKHNGVDFRAIGRSILSLSKKYRRKKGFLKSGGSTITMQLCRTLLIPSNQNPIKRKVIEILLSLWCEKQFSKADILSFYLTSVRFEKRINGIISATKYFFPNKDDKEYSNEEAFFLIERLSNISSTYREERIKNLYHRISENTDIDWKILLMIYNEQEMNERIAQYSRVGKGESHP
jgi:penicillin-binding protein 1A